MHSFVIMFIIILWQFVAERLDVKIYITVSNENSENYLIKLIYLLETTRRHKKKVLNVIKKCNS